MADQSSFKTIVTNFAYHTGNSNWKVMMLDKPLRELKEVTLSPVAKPIGRDIHPTAISLVSLVVGLASAIAVAFGWFPLALILWGANRFLDGLDGTVARQNHTQSDLGGYVDILSDFVVYAAIPIALALYAGTQAAFVAALILLATYYVNTASWMYLSGILEKRNQGAKAHNDLTTIHMPAGLIEGTETVVFYVLFLVFPANITALFGVFSMLVWITIAQRILWATRHLDG